MEAVARLHRKVRRQRLDHAHKTALGLVSEHDFIAHEDLKIRNMGKAPAPKPDPEQPGSFLPNGAAAKAGLNRSIADAGWGVFLAILAAKAEGAGRQVMAVDPRNTSRRCPECGHTAKENRPTRRSSTVRRAVTTRTLTPWVRSTFYGPGWSVATPTRHSEKPPHS